MSRRHRRSRRSDSHPIHFSPADLRELAAPAAKWLDTAHPLDFLSVHKVRTAVNDATRGAYAEIQWLWEQLEPADPILATCVDRRETALGKIPWDIVKKDGLTDAEDLLAESQLRTLTDFAHALQNLPQAVTALGQASFRSYRHLQLQETDDGSLRFNITDNWNWARDGYAGPWQWNPAATYGLTRGQELPVPWHSIITRTCPRPIDQPAMMLCLDRKNAKAQWLVYNERYGVPPVFAIMPQGIDESLRAEYMEFARQCISNAAGVLPAGSDVKTVTPGTGGPDTFRLAIEMANQELVLRSTGGLMTMLTAPGAGTNTETGNTHQSAFDDLAEAEAAEIAALLQKHVFAPCIRQWHPGQPVLAEFVLRRQESDSTAASVQNIATLSTAGYRTPAAQVADLTGLQVTDSGLPPAPGSIPTIPALNSFARRHSPAILYPPARAAFTRACSALATRLQAESTNAVRNTHPEDRSFGLSRRSRQAETEGPEPGLSPAELAAFQSIAASTLTPAAITTAAATAEQALEQAVATNTEGEDEATAQNGCTKPNCPKHPRHDSGSGIHAHKGGKSTRGKSDIGKTGSPNLVETGDSPRKQKRALTKAFAKVKRGEKVSTGYKVGSHELVLIPGNKEHYGRDHAERSEHPKKIPADKLAETAMRGERTNDQRNDVTIEGKGHVLVLSPQKQPSMAPGEKMKPRKKHDRLIGKNWYNRDNKKSPRQERRPTDG